MMGLDDPDHGRLRRLVQKVFTPSKVESFRPRIEQIVRDQLEVIQSLKSAESIDLVTWYAKPIPTIVIAEFLGLDSSDHALFKAWTDSLLKQGYPMPTQLQWDEIVSADNAMRKYMQKIVLERKLHAEEDLITAMVHASLEGDRLSEEEVVEMCCLLVGAGNFTTTDLISNAILALLQHPELIQSLQNGLTAIEAVIDECLRFDAPSLVARRFALEDIEIKGHNIQKGDAVNLVLAAANHDPAYFKSPDSFRINQDKSTHISFGRGVHHCLGAALARLEAKIAVEQFFNAFPGVCLKDFSRNKMMGFRGCRSLNVKLG